MESLYQRQILHFHRRNYASLDCKCIVVYLTNQQMQYLGINTSEIFGVKLVTIMSKYTLSCIMRNERGHDNSHDECQIHIISQSYNEIMNPQNYIFSSREQMRVHDVLEISKKRISEHQMTQSKKTSIFKSVKTSDKEGLNQHNFVDIYEI